jgi:RimJ/RimL family protein N-acetyltransferase
VPDRGDVYFARFAERHSELLAWQADGTDFLHVLVEEDGAIVGRVNLVEVVGGSAELGFRIAERAAGRGLATAAVRQVCARGRRVRIERAARGGEGRQRGDPDLAKVVGVCLAKDPADRRPATDSSAHGEETVRVLRRADALLAEEGAWDRSPMRIGDW